MSTEWIPVFVLPNAPLLTPIGCDIAALVPADDPRVEVIKKTQPMLGRFLGRFSDNFGVKFEPTILIVRADAPQSFFQTAALASFRDLIAIAAIANSRARQLRQRGGHRIVFGEAFSIYPWMLDKHYEEVIGNTPAILGTHEVSKLRGQSTPSLFRTPLGESDLDHPLLTLLLDRWRRRYSATEPRWEDIALFRSLNMAYHASLMPAGTEITFYDLGRLVSLWVSAFEILVHPGQGGRANRDKVFELIETTRWALPTSGELAYDTGGRIKVKRTLASWLYQALNKCRNDFLHGEPVDRDGLFLPLSERTVLEYAAPLYRLALTAFLPLVYERPIPAASDPKELGAYIAERMEFRDPQKLAEEAILTAMQAQSQ